MNLCGTGNWIAWWFAAGETRSSPEVGFGEVTWTCCRHLGDVLRTGLILDDGQLEPDHRTAVFAVWRKANPWGGATAGHTQIGLLAHITSGPPGIEQRILANFPFAHGRLAPPAA